MVFLDEMSRLGTALCGVNLLNPVLAASGTFGYGVEFMDVVDLNAIGGVVVKGLSLEPIRGNPSPRLYETDGGMINSVGSISGFVGPYVFGYLYTRTHSFSNGLALMMVAFVAGGLCTLAIPPEHRATVA